MRKDKFYKETAALIEHHLQTFGKSKSFVLYQVGLEKESLKIDKEGKLDLSKHPDFLGSPLFNRLVTLDFSNSQLEWTTPPFSHFSKALTSLTQTQSWTMQPRSKESIHAFWPYSMPMHQTAPTPLADFGSSPLAKEKKLYRKGLCHRYGRHVQTISGVHLNLSFPSSFWKILYENQYTHVELDAFITDRYFHICRNYLRYGWLISYLFGASPFTFEPQESLSKKQGCYLFENATSLRMSPLGYYSRIQEQMSISYQSLSAYLQDMNTYLNKPRSTYTKKIKASSKPLMLSDNYLQTINEHYARIRPKSLNLEKRGNHIFMPSIDYLEIRSLDLNPLSPLGIDQSTCEFIHLFLLFCLMAQSPNLSKSCQTLLTKRQTQIALHGRDTHKKLAGSSQSIEQAGLEICQLMEPIANALDIKTKGRRYTQLLKKAMRALKNPEHTFSGQLVKALKKEKSVSHLTKKLTEKQRSFFKNKANQRAVLGLEKEVALSKRKQASSEAKARLVMPGFEMLEYSTQVLIKAAHQEGVTFKVLDERHHVIELKKGKKEATVKQATITALDSYLSYSLMQSKGLTKTFLTRAGIEAPMGDFFSDPASAIAAFDTYNHHRMVIKPLDTNYGLGIHFIEKGDKKGWVSAVEACFRLSDHVIIERFIKGKEYRFLVIDGNVNGVIYREPANVVGDGSSSIRTLVEKKNEDPYYYRKPYFLRLALEEKAKLKAAGFSSTSVPAKNQKVYLRENSNISTGGDAIEVSHEVPTFFKKIAVKAASSVGARICGIDMIIPSFKQESYSIIELNYNPAIFFHAVPFKGKGSDPGRAILKMLKLIE